MIRLVLDHQPCLLAVCHCAVLSWGRIQSLATFVHKRLSLLSRSSINLPIFRNTSPRYTAYLVHFPWPYTTKEVAKNNWHWKRGYLGSDCKSCPAGATVLYPNLNSKDSTIMYQLLPHCTCWYPFTFKRIDNPQSPHRTHLQVPATLFMSFIIPSDVIIAETSTFLYVPFVPCI